MLSNRPGETCSQPLIFLLLGLIHPFEQLRRMRRLYDPGRLRAEPDRTRDKLGCCRRYEPTACGYTPRGASTSDLAMDKSVCFPVSSFLQLRLPRLGLRDSFLTKIDALCHFVLRRFFPLGRPAAPHRAAPASLTPARVTLFGQRPAWARPWRPAVSVRTVVCGVIFVPTHPIKLLISLRPPPDVHACCLVLHDSEEKLVYCMHFNFVNNPPSAP